MITWVIYEHPKDFPNKFVARPFFTGCGWYTALEFHKTADTLEGIRASLPTGLVRTERHPSDDSVIVEVWI